MAATILTATMLALHQIIVAGTSPDLPSRRLRQCMMMFCMFHSPSLSKILTVKLQQLFHKFFMMEEQKNLPAYILIQRVRPHFLQVTLMHSTSRQLSELCIVGTLMQPACHPARQKVLTVDVAELLLHIAASFLTSQLLRRQMQCIRHFAMRQRTEYIIIQGILARLLLILQKVHGIQVSLTIVRRSLSQFIPVRNFIRNM